MSTHQFWIDHFSAPDPEIHQTFISLKPKDCHEVLAKMGISPLDGKAFESAENRVFGFGEIVLKFYRPGRWSLDAIKDEWQFLKDLSDANIPFVRPHGEVGTWRGLHYLAYQAVPTPFVEDKEVLSEEEVRKLVQVVAGLHEVGEKREAPARAQFDPKGMSEGCFEVIQRAGFLPSEYHRRYEIIIEELRKKIEAVGDIPLQRIHGDCYSGNVLWTNEGPLLMDLDDFQVGPVALDIKLLSFPWRLDSLAETMDRRERRKIQHQMVLDLYREHREFPKKFEALFPLLSSYRDIQFDAWFSARWREPGFAQNYPDDDITQKEWWNESLAGHEEILSHN